MLASDTSSGALSLNADGSFGYTPNLDFIGQDSFTYHAHDGSATSNIATVTLTVNGVNGAPAATDDSYQTAENTPLVVGAANGVLANDSDAEMDALQAVLESDVSNGVLNLNADGSFDYTPNADFTGQDSFEYLAYNGSGISNIATVTLTISTVNNDPVAVNDSYQTAENTPLVMDATNGVLANDSDVEQAALQAILESDAANGVLNLNVDGSFDYTPNADFSGQDSFKYRASDGSTVSNIATVTLTVNSVNEAPVATGDSYQTAENTPLVTDVANGVLANDSDTEMGALQAVLESGPSNGVLNLSADGSFDYTPNADFIGQDSFTYHAFDGLTASNTATVTVTVDAVDVGNDAPQLVTGEDDFTKQVIANKVNQTHSVMVADLDADTDIDLVATDYVDNSVFWYENDGNGDFVERVLDANLEGAYPSHVGDVDSDGDIDVLAGGYKADTFAWYRNNGGGSFTRINIDTKTDGAHSIVTSDVDQDGDVDLVTSSQDAGTITWYENNGTNSFKRFIIDRTALGAKRAEVADIDGDGDLDVATASYDAREIAWLENDGNQSFTKHVLDNQRDGAYHVSPADADGDGDIDIFSASKLDNTIAWYRNDGAAGFTVQILDTKAIGARGIIAVDLDRDGDMDALATSREDDTIAWFVNNGGGNFTWRPIDLHADGAYGVNAIDMDHDGDIDVASASRMSGEVSVHTRTRTHNAEIKVGGTLSIDSAMLRAADTDDGPAELTYTIINAPNYGEVRVDGVSLPAGSTFTQADIDNGHLTYVHYGSSYQTAHAFFFTVADGGEDGAQPVEGGFSIRIIIPAVD